MKKTLSVAKFEAELLKTRTLILHDELTLQHVSNEIMRRFSAFKLKKTSIQYITYFTN